MNDKAAADAMLISGKKKCLIPRRQAVVN